MQGALAIGKVRISEPASSNELAVFLSLWKQARERKLHQHPLLAETTSFLFNW